MATHSSVLAWRIPGTGEPGGLPLYGVAQSQTQLKRLSNSSSSILNLGHVTWHEAASPRQDTSLIRLRNVVFGSAVAFEYRRENYGKEYNGIFHYKTNLFFLNPIIQHRIQILIHSILWFFFFFFWTSLNLIRLPIKLSQKVSITGQTG